MIENPIDHRVLGNERDDPHLSAARGTAEGIEFEDLPEELGPAPACLVEQKREQLGNRRRLTRGRLASAS